ncbi:NH(3)-dependent NAD(+) synthetase [Tepiditoga spiralis]|uniref:NH(3)-dependent NAD(+) synthetase n=1 Tax=Tepiditoga spiralis TaxID=2108365 RepID=A0A7G1G8B9_9BACT|nr:NAD(+) synthase [Tepiditoga spiralis]BBE31474.1 NH(3)-dependent NAD(+) synthetase [Tepiditoga spiralis]
MEKIIEFIKNTVNKYGYKGAVIGISGGIDSAVVAGLCKKAIGKENIFALLLPEKDSSKNTLKDSIDVCNFYDLDYKIKKISPILKKMGVYSLEPSSTLIPRNIKEKYVMNKWTNEKDTYIQDLKNEGDSEFLKGLAYYRAKHRVRMCMLYLEAEQRNYAVIGTTNKTELKTGFYVKYGDDSVDIEPIMHLYKTEVYELSKKLNIPKHIINKSPSPDLIPGITDEFAMGLTYKNIDRILKKIENNETLETENKKEVERVKEILKWADYRKIKNINFKI